MLAVVGMSLPARAQTVDEMIAKVIAAQGGLEKIKAVETERLVGRIALGPDVEGPFMVELKRPNKMHMEIKIQEMTLSRTYDGKSGWLVNPLDGKVDPTPMSAEDLKSASEQADFDGPFVDYKAKGNQIELVGKEDVGGKSAHKLKVTFKNGDVHLYYVDANSFLKVKWESQRMVNGSPITVQSFFSDYRQVNGLMFPFRIQSESRGSPQKQEMVLASVEVNATVDDSHFGVAGSERGTGLR